MRERGLDWIFLMTKEDRWRVQLIKKRMTGIKGNEKREFRDFYSFFNQKIIKLNFGLNFNDR